MKKSFNLPGCSILLFLTLFVSILLPWSLVHAWTLRPWEPSSRSPANGATNISTTPTFSWSDGYSSYMICLTKDPSLTAGYIPCIGSAEGTSYTVPESMRLEPNTSYYWEISAWRSGNTYDSSVWSFTTCSPLSITTDTNPSGFQIKVDGTSYTAPHTFSWETGTTHSVEALSPQSIGNTTFYAFSSWSDGQPQMHTITVPTSNATYTANFSAQTKYSITTSANPASAGSVTLTPPGTQTLNAPSLSWFDPGQSVTLTALSNAEYEFTYWSGDLASIANPAAITMSGTKNVTANFGGPYNEWINLGPQANVQALAIDPQSRATLYAGTAGGVYKTTDGGGTWALSNTNLTTTDVRALAIDPSAPSTIYAGTWGGGVFKSTDSGNSWNSTNWPDNYKNILDLAINPQTPSVIYAAVYSSGVYKSTNSGLNWNITAQSGDMRAIAIDPNTPTTIYAGNWSIGVYKTTNGGTSWSPMNSGLLRLNVTDLAIDPLNTSILLAGIFYNDPNLQGGVYKSTDGGASWNQVMPSRIMGPLAIDPASPLSVYAGTDGNGVFNSLDGGNTWKLMNNGLTSLNINKLVTFSNSPYTLYVATGNGVFRSQPVDQHYHPADTNKDHRVTMDEAVAYGNAWRSGQTWQTSPNPIPIEYVTNAGYIAKMGEAYHYDAFSTPPWVPGN